MASCTISLRATVLFFVGTFFSVVLNLLQKQRGIPNFPMEFYNSYLTSDWWVHPVVGVAAACIGLLYPFFDQKLGEPLVYKREWSSVMRCVAVFVGINHASARLDFADNFQLSLTLAAMSIGLWWLFDRSGSGFSLGVGIAVLATFMTQLVVYSGIYRYTKADFLFVRSWVPCIFFSGGVTFGNIGRQLAVPEEEEEKVKND
ncbi:Hypothetical predicted protein [Mytilus galloprovincialis]|uniref:Insulin-induced gene protein n=1 Tax=Mytilus galloprovincialis TaxID=29158 RepID=A0A8B6HBW8_MYTGA|nr:Hypothetical predicted protein [Mytilus galloprovincialis]